MLSTFDSFAAPAISDETAPVSSRAHSYAAARRKAQNIRTARAPRMMLGALAQPNKSHEFAATVGRRGMNGSERTILLRDLQPTRVGCVFEDHLWVPYDAPWKRLEPFFQGLKVVLIGRVIPYTRKNGTMDYTLKVEKVASLTSPHPVNCGAQRCPRRDRIHSRFENAASPSVLDRKQAAEAVQAAGNAHPSSAASP